MSCRVYPESFNEVLRTLLWGGDLKEGRGGGDKSEGVLIPPKSGKSEPSHQPPRPTAESHKGLLSDPLSSRLHFDFSQDLCPPPLCLRRVRCGHRPQTWTRTPPSDKLSSCVEIFY